MSIVTNHGPYRKRRKPAAQAANIAVPRIVQHTPRGRGWRSPAVPLPPDPEGERAAAEFLARMVRKTACPRP